MSLEFGRERVASEMIPKLAARGERALRHSALTPLLQVDEGHLSLKAGRERILQL